MVSNFESQKNAKAAGYTTGIIILLLLLLFFVKWVTPVMPVPPVEEGIEVNLGNSDQGFGDDQPFEPGDPAPQNQNAYVPPKVNVAENNDVKEVETDDKEEDAPAIAKPPVVKPNATKIPEKEVAKVTPKKTMPAAPPTPAPPKPKAIFKGASGTGTGGNNADSYKKGGSEGIAGGTGDQGRPGGDPNSKNYEGGGKGNGSFQIVKGDRRIVSGNFSFTGDFDENATVFAEISISADGRGTFLRTTKGSTTTSRQYTDQIVQKLKTIKFNTASDESSINVRFNFKVTQ